MAQTRRDEESAPRKRTTKAAAGKKDPNGHLYGGRARDREVIEAAVDIFAEKGYANASVQDVAEHLGMLKGSLYYYINSKESLLQKIFDDSHAEISTITDQAMESPGTGLERLTRYLTDYAMWTLTHLKRASLYSREWRYASEELQATLQDHARYYNRSLRSLIVTCQDEGSIPGTVDPRVSSLFIWSALTTLPDWFNPSRDSEQAVADRYVAMALRAVGVVDPLTAAAPPSRARVKSASKQRAAAPAAKKPAGAAGKKT